MELHTLDILKTLKMVAESLDWDAEAIEILLIGGTAGMLTGQLPAHRVTQDCDVMNFQPQHSQQAVLDAAKQVASEYDLSENWLNTQAMNMNILPDGWRSRRVHIADFGKLSIFAVSRLDLLAMKFFANRPQDRQDILEMKPTLEEIEYIRKYLDMLRVPSRQADLDQVVSAFALVDAMEELFHEQ